jgi:hypothetical protein
MSSTETTETTTTMTPELLMTRIKQLSALPDGVLQQIWTNTNQEGGPVTRDEIIMRVAPQIAITWEITQCPEIDKKCHNIDLLVKNFPKIIKKGIPMTSLSFKQIVENVYEIPDTELVMFNTPHEFLKNFGKFGVWFVAKTGGKSEALREHCDEILAKFREIMFITVDADLLQTIATNVTLDAVTVNMTENGCGKDFDLGAGYIRMVHNELEFPLREGESLGGGRSYNVSETLERLVPNWQHEAPAANVIVADENIDMEGINITSKSQVDVEALMDTHKKMAPGRFTAWSWRQLRKDLGITGRADIWICQDPGENAQQNKHLKYKSETVCEQGNQGAMTSPEMPGVYFTWHPYGQITIVV